MRYLVLCLILMVSCIPDEPAFHVGREKEVRHIDADLEEGKEPTSKFVDAFGLKTGINEFDPESMKLHGKFFNDRISFYTVQDPGIKLYDSNVQSITLYFIDSALMRKKYMLEGDISSDLIQLFGNFKFTPLHEAEKAALRNKEVLNRSNGKVRINERLANYQLRWIQDVNTLSYVSNFNFADSTFSYELVQEVNYYRPYFRMVEYAN